MTFDVLVFNSLDFDKVVGAEMRYGNAVAFAESLLREQFDKEAKTLRPETQRLVRRWEEVVDKSWEGILVVEVFVDDSWVIRETLSVIQVVPSPK